MLTRSNSNSSTERPVLRLGLAGFSTAEQSSLNVALASRAAQDQIKWQLVPLGEADAWCVNGSRVQGLPDGTLRIVPGLPSGRSIRINPTEIDWPVAFSTPLAAPDFKAAYLFQCDAPESIVADAEAARGLAAAADGAVLSGLAHRGEEPRPAHRRLSRQRQRQAVRAGRAGAAASACGRSRIRPSCATPCGTTGPERRTPSPAISCAPTFPS